MLQTRMPAVAGTFYPAQATQLQAMVDEFLSQASSQGPIPKALIAPHAGYRYCGAIAASVYQRLQGVADGIQRVVLLGPSHRVPFWGIATLSADQYQTPLGNIPVERDTLERLCELRQVIQLDQAHAFEHSLEVHLPFLQRVLNTPFTLVPLVVGDASPEAVAEVLAQVWGGPETLIVVSSDLSHYHDYSTACNLDQQTSQAIRDLDYQALNPNQACGHHPVSGLLHLARKMGMHGEIVDLRNSGDTSGDKARVVGYGAYAFY